jgi:hypothetical protein
MDPVHEEAVETWPTDTLVLGNSSWHGGADRSLKYAWPDKNGKRARGGEIPMSAVPQAVMFASRKASSRARRPPSSSRDSSTSWPQRSSRFHSQGDKGRKIALADSSA